MKPFVDRRGVGLSFFSAETYTCIPLTIVPKLRICIGCSKRFQDRQGVSSLEQVRADYSGPCVAHNRRPKCHRKLPLELHFLAAVSLKYYVRWTEAEAKRPDGNNRLFPKEIVYNTWLPFDHACASACRPCCSQPMRARVARAAS